MDLSNYSEYIQKKMSEKGINTETQDYVIQYICMNQELFGNYLNIDKVLDRIINNLNCSISSSLFDNIDIKRPIKDFIELTHISGCWFPHRNEIYINPIIKLKTMLSQKERKRTLSIIMHEMDHCATTEYIDQQEIEQYFQAHSEYYKNNIEKKEEKTSSATPDESRSTSPSSTSDVQPIFELFGIKLFLDDLIILGILFFLYKEEVKDDMLYIILFLLLFA